MASQRLLESASAVVERYRQLPGLRMAIVTGSVARGVADSASDLDVYLYWEAVDRDAVADRHRLDGLADRLVVGLPTASGWFAKHRIGDRYVDIESVDIDVLTGIRSVLEGGEPLSAEAAKVIVGLRDGVAIVGAQELTRWQRTLVYNDAVAVAEVARHGRGLLAPTARASDDRVRAE